MGFWGCSRTLKLTTVTRQAREEGEPMEKVTSRDGTPIAFDRMGDGPPVILVCGAMCDRALMRPTAEELAKHFTVFNYDRRGRGYCVGVRALLGGGPRLARGGARGAHRQDRAARPPYAPDGDEEARRSSREYGENLKATLSEGRRGEAVELFMTMVGMPQEMIEGMRHTPRWAELEALAPTLAYDSEVMGDTSRDGTIPVEKASRVTVPALVLTGGADYPWMIEVGRRLADAMPDGRHRVLEGQEHTVPPEVLAPVLEGFFSHDTRP